MPWPLPVPSLLPGFHDILFCLKLQAWTEIVSQNKSFVLLNNFFYVFITATKN
jgi:hypothetical protein